MTVVLFEDALTRLLDSPASPIVLLVERKAQEITLLAQQNVRDYFQSAPALIGGVDQDVDYLMEGNTAVVGINDEGSKSRRLARYQAEGSVNWLRNARDTVAAGG